MKLPLNRLFFATLAALALSSAASAQTSSVPVQGVTKDEILLGSIQDLSGPLAGYGKQSRAGMQLAVDEINEQGGIAGRKLKLLVEDDGYDPKKIRSGSTKARQSGQDFHHARPHRHGPEPRCDAGSV